MKSNFKILIFFQLCTIFPNLTFADDICSAPWRPLVINESTLRNMTRSNREELRSLNAISDQLDILLQRNQENKPLQDMIVVNFDNDRSSRAIEYMIPLSYTKVKDVERYNLRIIRKLRERRGGGLASREFFDWSYDSEHRDRTIEKNGDQWEWVSSTGEANEPITLCLGELSDYDRADINRLQAVP